MLPLYSAVLSSDGLFADLIDLRGLYGAGRLRLTVDRGSVRLSAGAAQDALDVIGDYSVGVFEVSIPLTRLVKVERLTGNSSTILVEILPHTADKRNVIATLSDGVVRVLAGETDITDQIGGGASDGPAGTGMTYTVRNLDSATVTRIMLPSAPAELMLNWYDSTGSSGNLRYVLEAASLADATARLNDDTAHGELVANGAPAVVKFEPTMYPVYIYVRASSAVGAGSNILSLLAKVTQ